MKNTIIKIGYGAAAVAMICVPFVAMAQWNPGAQQGMGYQLPTGATGVGGIFQTVIKWLLYILGFAAVLVFVIAGIMYLTSGGDETRMEKAKKAVIAAIIGIVVALIGLIVLNVISGLLTNNSGV